MLIIPAIDIKDGYVVRLVQGKLNKKVYSHDPVRTAKHWVRQGAKLLHIVDLDGASTGIPKNLNIVRDILNAVDIPLQLGGGIRSIATIKKIIDYGVWRVVLGTKAVEDSNFLKKAFSQYREKIIVSVDAENDKVLVKGWQKSHKNIDVSSFVHGLKEIGFKQLIYTDISKDGTLKGPNIKSIKNLLLDKQINVIASGGVSSLEDIYRLKMLENKGLIGIIVGKALYEGKFTLSQSLKMA